MQKYSNARKNDSTVIATPDCMRARWFCMRVSRRSRYHGRMATKQAGTRSRAGGPVRVHHTRTVERQWDGPATESKLPDDAGIEEFRKLFAWIDPNQHESKTPHKFPHHEVTARGQVSAANKRAAINGIAVLNGARGGARIPASDRKRVYAHLAAHLRDAGDEPPALER